MEVIDPFINLLNLIAQQFTESDEDLSIRLVNLINIRQFVHFRQGEAEVFEPFDKFEALKVLLGKHPLSPFHPLHRMEETDLLVITNGPGTHLGQVSDLSDFEIWCWVHFDEAFPDDHLT